MKKSVRLLLLPYILTVVIFFLLSILQEVIITNKFSWPIIWIDFAMDVATITIAFAFIFYLLDKLYKYESKLLSSNNSLSEMNYELENFIYRASHDFRTPLMNIKGLLVAFEFDKNKESSDKYLALLQKSTDMLDSRLLELMETATIKHKIKTTEKIKVVSLLKELVDEVNFTASMDKITCSIEGDESIIVLSDTVRLKILLRSILVNAVKYIDVAKKNHVIQIEVRWERDHVKITFWDNGIGIPESILPKIFEMFYRGTQISNGAGLGLYIAKTISISLKYDISVTSKEEKWTEVVVSIPS